MLLFYVLLIISVLPPPTHIAIAGNLRSWNFRLVGETFERERFDYLGRNQTDAIKGVFIFVVFFSHLMPYLLCVGYVPNILDVPVVMFNNRLGQLMVVMFLFYSGYGVADAIKKKGMVYVNAIPQRRVLPTMFNFALAVCVFMILCLLTGIDISWHRFALALIAWESIGNSNWYIFCIVYCYCITYLSAYIAHTSTRKHITGIYVLLFLIAYIVAMNIIRPYDVWWRDTICAYGFGYIYSENRSRAEYLVNRFGYPFCLGVCIVVFLLLYFCQIDWFGFILNMRAVVFAMLVVLISMRIRITSRLLVWMGTNLFSLYMYQRLPMLALSKVDNGVFMLSNPYVYTVLCIASTVVIAVAVERLNLYNRVKNAILVKA